MIERVLYISSKELDDVKRLGEPAFASIGVGGTFHSDTFIHFWNGFLGNGYGAMWKYTVESKIVASIGMALTMSFMDGGIVAEQVFWAIDPKYRKTAGAKLFSEMLQWAKKSGCKRILMSSLTNFENERVSGFLKHRGFSPLQTQYYLNL